MQYKTIVGILGLTVIGLFGALIQLLVFSVILLVFNLQYNFEDLNLVFVSKPYIYLLYNLAIAFSVISIIVILHYLYIVYKTIYQGKDKCP